MKNKITITVVTLLATYFVSYATLSSLGQYVPGSIGSNGVKYYVWAPRGFVSGPYGTQWNHTLARVYAPLWILDHRFIHTPDRAWQNKYPVNRTFERAHEEAMEQDDGVEGEDGIGDEPSQ